MLFSGVGVVLEVFGELDDALCVVFGVVLVFLGCEFVGVHGFVLSVFLCITSLSYVCLVLSTCGWVCCVTWCLVVASAVPFMVSCGLWCLLVYPLCLYWLLGM